jgi:hypothetical protein
LLSRQDAVRFAPEKPVIKVRGFLFSCVSLMAVLCLLAADGIFAQSNEARAVLTPDSADSNVLLARGLLTRRGKADSLWTLEPKNSPKIRGESIIQVTFTTPPGQGTQTYASYDGKIVELIGEVQSVLNGNAVLSKIRTIGILDSPTNFTASLRTGSLTSSPSDSSEKPGDRVAYKHAYYLLLASVPTGCQACYVPLLITQLSLEEIAKGNAVALGVYIVTYERDSIWEVKGAAPIEAAAIDAPPRMIHLTGNAYRYLELFPSEVLKLIENPSGAIPISRPLVMNKAVPGASLPQLIADFRNLQDRAHSGP